MKTQRRKTTQQNKHTETERKINNKKHYKKETDLCTNHCSLKEKCKHKEERQHNKTNTQRQKEKLIIKNIIRKKQTSVRIIAA